MRHKHHDRRAEFKIQLAYRFKKRIGMEETMKSKGISGSTLKTLAIIMMLIDHIAAVLYVPIAQANILPISQEQLYQIYYVMRCIGRFSFPIFAFLLAEGLIYTKSREKYLRNLLLFGLVSEIPFDLALHGTWFDWSSQNVFFTLAIAAIALMIGEDLNQRLQVKQQWIRTLNAVIPVFLCALLAEVIGTDYGAVGVIVVVIFYRMRPSLMVASVINFLLLIGLSSLEAFAFPYIIALYFYNGKRGKQIKYLFYAFYPVHFVLLYLVILQIH